MLGDREALVLAVGSLDVHGVGYVDVTLGFRDGTMASARLGRESVPEDLRKGESVLVATAMNVVLTIRRAEGDELPNRLAP